MSQIFISYSRSDLDFVQELVDRLRRRSYRVWMDKSDIKPGSNWQEAIGTAIEASDVLVVILSEAAIASEWVGIEYDTALNKGVTVIPYVYENVDLPLRLQKKNAIFHKEDDAFEKLVKALPQSTHIHDSSAVEHVGKPDKTFAEVAETVDEALKLFVMHHDKRIELRGLPLRATKYCMTYLVGRANDTLEWIPQAQIGLQLAQPYPGDNFPTDIANHFLQDDPEFRLRLILVRGPLKMSFYREQYSPIYGLDVEAPEEWADVPSAVQAALNIYESGTRRPDLQIFMLGPGTVLYRLGTQHRDYYRAELYQYDPAPRRYYRVLGQLSS